MIFLPGKPLYDRCCQASGDGVLKFPYWLIQYLTYDSKMTSSKMAVSIIFSKLGQPTSLQPARNSEIVLIGHRALRQLLTKHYKLSVPCPVVVNVCIDRMYSTGHPSRWKDNIGQKQVFLYMYNTTTIVHNNYRLSGIIPRKTISSRLKEI